MRNGVVADFSAELMRQLTPSALPTRTRELLTVIA